MDLTTRLDSLPGIGPRMSGNLKRLGLSTVEDLLWHFPTRYDDFSNQSTLSEVRIGEIVSIKGQIWSIKNIFTKHHKRLTQAVLNDGTNSIELVWFNSHWLTKQIGSGDYLQISGKVNRVGNKLSMVMPVWEKITAIEDSTFKNQDSTIHTGRLVSVYPETFGLTSKWLRNQIDHIMPQVLDQVDESLDEQYRQGMISLRESISEVHLPKTWESLEKARVRLGFEEMLLIQLATQKVRLEWEKRKLVTKIDINRSNLAVFTKSLPFLLTNAQQKVIDELIEDFGRDCAMNRLIQGDVGSGKTVVTAALIFLLSRAGFRSLVMAPTEVLARQHLETLTSLLSPFGIQVGLQTGSAKVIKKGSKNKLPDVVVGTHALISKNFNLPNVGLVVVDEQHRFGVNQRLSLRNLAQVPHFLSMTATPIPRTVVLTLYGDLDVSVIDEMPKERLKIKTYLVPPVKRDDAYGFVRQHIKAGEQAYIVVPLIEDSENLASVKAVKSEFKKLSTEIFADLKLGLLHGRLKPGEKQQVLEEFRSGKIDILVTTPVVEVGVDVRNATIMVIEGAERFGLASLHQLRGRVGRGDKQSFCLLFLSPDSEPESERLKHLEKINNGLELAELDLKIRGGGQVFGSLQSGRFELKLASLTDLDLISRTREVAKKILRDDSLHSSRSN